MGFSSAPDLSALDQYRPEGKPSVRYWSLRLINRVITKTPCNNIYLFKYVMCRYNILSFTIVILFVLLSRKLPKYGVRLHMF